MRLFLDTANIEHIKHGARLGVISGVTTNPSLVSKEGKVNYKKLVQEICSIIPGPVSTEVISQDADGMVAEARKIAKWAKNVVVKIPAGLEGTEATHVLCQGEYQGQLYPLFFGEPGATGSRWPAPPMSARLWAGWMISAKTECS